MRLLNTRPPNAARALTEALVSAGHSVVHSALIHIRPLDVAPLDLTDVQALVVTSANGLAAAAKLIKVRDLRIYCVGDKTARAAKAGGFTNIMSANADVAALAALIIGTADKAAGRLLHVGGARLAGDLQHLLEEAGFSYSREILYEAVDVTEFSAEAHVALEKNQLDGILFFSPHTAKVFKKLVDAKGLSAHISHMDAWCLSANVAGELSGLDFRQVHVAKHPTENALLAMIDKAVAIPARETDKRADGPREQTVSKTPEKDVKGAATTAAKSDKDVKSPPSKSQPSKSPPLKSSPPKSSGGSKGGGSTATAPKTSSQTSSQSGPKSNMTRNLVILLVVFSLGLALWPLILPKVATVLPEQSRLVLQGYLGGAPVDNMALESRLQALEASLVQAQTTTKPAQITQITMRLTELKNRLDAVSEQSADLAAMTGRLSAIEAAIAQINEAMADLKRPQPVASAATGAVVPNSAQASDTRVVVAKLEAILSGLEAEIARVKAEQSLSENDLAAQKAQIDNLQATLKAQLAQKQVKDANGDETLILLALGQLHRESLSNQPFAGALQQALAVAPEALQADLAKLSEVAQSGAPTLRELRESFAAQATQITQAARLPGSDTWYGKTLNNLASLVKFRRVGGGVGGDGASGDVDVIVARAEQKINAGDLAAGVVVLKTLDGPAADAARLWVSEAEKRVLVDETLSRLLGQVTANAVLDKQAGK